MVRHFVLENRNEDSGKILAKLIDKQAKLQQRAEPVVISCGYMCFRHTRQQVEKGQSQSPRRPGVTQIFWIKKLSQSHARHL